MVPDEKKELDIKRTDFYEAVNFGVAWLNLRAQLAEAFSIKTLKSHNEPTL